MRISPLRITRRSSSCSSRDDPTIPKMRIPMIRVVMPVFFGAICIYALLVVCSYPLLTGNRSTNRFERLVFPDEGQMGDQMVGDVEGIAPRTLRDIAVEALARRPSRQQGKSDIIDRVLRKGKRASKHDIVSMPEDANVEEPTGGNTKASRVDNFERVKADIIKGVKSVKANKINGADSVKAGIVSGVDKGRGNVVQQPVDAEAGVVVGVAKGGGDIAKHPPLAENGQPQAEMAVKKKPYYNKLITVPKSERYIDEPIDVHRYSYIHRPDVCRNAEGQPLKIQVIFMVTTAPRNFERRQLIRETYGNKRNWPVLHSGSFRTVFLLGAVANASLQREIDAEFAVHGGDIVQEDFIDSYANLTLKTVMGLKWVTNHCRQATFTMKIDDDSMIHQNRMLRMLKTSTPANFTAAEALINVPVLRNTSSKYYIAEKYFPAPTYPPYLNGPGYMVSTDLAEDLYRVATSIPLFPWEDVFLGLCLQELGVVPEERHDFMLIIAEFSQIADKSEAVKLFRYFTVVSNLEPEYMKLMWDSFRFQPSKNAKKF